MMYHLNTRTQFLADTEHVYSLFFEIKQEHPFLDDMGLMTIINKVTGWEYPSNRKNEFKDSILKLLNLKN